jgi:translation initiation factor 5B
LSYVRPFQTQHIGASFFPLETIKEICEPILGKRRWEIKIPGILVIDTPGHRAFFNLRQRGGSVADIAILVIDIIKGVEDQTIESIEVLRARKTPFLVAANKIDLIPGWRPFPSSPCMESIGKQEEAVRRELEERLYNIIGSLSKLGFSVDRFDRIRDFTRTVAIVPVSAKTGEGIPELLLVLIGLTQQYMQKRLGVSKGAAKGSVLEVKEEPGLGTTLNAIIFDGILKQGDTIVLAGKERPIVTKVRALLLPKPLQEMRAPTEAFVPVSEVSAAAGVKIVAQGLEEALSGSPLYAVPSEDTPEKYVKAVLEEIGEFRILTDKLGVILKADTLGSLEALKAELEAKGIPVRMADIGDVSKRDVVEAKVVKRAQPNYGVILAFNVKVLPDALEEAMGEVEIFRREIIYQLIDDYLEWVRKKEEDRLREAIKDLVFPGKIRILPGYVFRRSKPAIVGVEVLAGRIRPRNAMLKADGREAGTILQIQDKGKAISEASKGMEVAISLEGPIVGRHIEENDILYVNVPERHAKALRERFLNLLSPDDIKVLEEFIELQRKSNPSWAL